MKPVILIGVLLLVIFITPDTFAHCKGKHATNPPAGHCDGGGDGGDNEAPSPSNLVRASFLNFGGLGSGEGGISADGLDTCTIERNGVDVTYDYWAWQERLLSESDSMLGVGTDSDDNSPCFSYENRSDVSGGGRWFLMTSAGEVQQEQVVRWLAVDFSDNDIDGVISGCPDLDGAGNSDMGIDPIYSAVSQYPHNNTDSSPCVDNLSVWLKADRVLKNKANQQQLEISIRYRPDGSDYWIPWGSIEHVNPLFLRDPPHTSGPFEGRDCRVMSTRAADGLDHTQQLAELTISVGAGQSDVVGRYNLPLEICVIRASN